MNPIQKKYQSLSTQSSENCHVPFIIGVCGGTASGKTSVCTNIIKNLGLENKNVVIISQDSFYKSLSHDVLDTVKEYNFDHPDAFDWKLIEAILKDLSEGKSVKIPVYDFVTHSRKDESHSTPICDVDIVLFEGILAFYVANIRRYMRMKIFVDTDADTRLSRRILRDIAERGRDLEGVLNQYEKFVKPSFEEWILPTKKYADVIIPRGADNLVAIDLIVQHIKLKLVEKSYQKKAYLEQLKNTTANNNNGSYSPMVNHHPPYHPSSSSPITISNSSSSSSSSSSNITPIPFANLTRSPSKTKNGTYFSQDEETKEK